MRCPDNIEEPSRQKKRERALGLLPPATRHININVGDSFLGGSGKWGIGSVSMDSEGKVIFQFKKEVSVDSKIYVELLVLWEEILVRLYHDGLHYILSCSNQFQSRL